MKLRDIGYSLLREIGSDSAGSAFDHLTVMGRIAFTDFIRFGRGVPRGFFEEAGLRFSPKMTDIHKGVGKPVVIVPIGEVDTKIIETVARVATDVYGLPVRILRSRTIWPTAYDPKDGSADASKILSILKPMLKVGRVVALTDIPLKATMQDSRGDAFYGPVYGYGGIGWPVSVVSTDKLGLEEPDEISLARLVRVAVHELAHGFGAHHHQDDQIPCVMNMMEGKDGQLGLDRMTHELCTKCLGIVMVDGKSKASEETESCFS